jgi:hypothetical protein
MALKDIWKNKVDGEDDILAEHINSVAQAVIELEESKKEEKNNFDELAQKVNAFPMLVNDNIEKSEKRTKDEMVFLANSLGEYVENEETAQYIDIPKGVSKFNLKSIGGVSVREYLKSKLTLDFSSGYADLIENTTTKDGAHHIKFSENVYDFSIIAKNQEEIPEGLYRFQFKDNSYSLIIQSIDVSNDLGTANLINSTNSYFDVELVADNESGVVNANIKVDVSCDFLSEFLIDIDFEKIDETIISPVKAIAVVSEDSEGNVIDSFDFEELAEKLPFYGMSIISSARIITEKGYNYIDFSKKQYIWRWVDGGVDEGTTHLIDLSNEEILNDYESVKSLNVISGGKIKIITDKNMPVPICYSYVASSDVEGLKDLEDALDRIIAIQESLIGGELE